MRLWFLFFRFNFRLGGDANRKQPTPIISHMTKKDIFLRFKIEVNLGYTGECPNKTAQNYIKFMNFFPELYLGWAEIIILKKIIVRCLIKGSWGWRRNTDCIIHCYRGRPEPLGHCNVLLWLRYSCVGNSETLELVTVQYFDFHWQ